MCRFAFYLGEDITLSSLVTAPNNSVVKQSMDSREGVVHLNGDGFGLAWFVPEVRQAPAIFKDTNPAWNSLNLANLADVTRSPCVLAHVRAASPGLPVTQLNCHPFVCSTFAFMHNGSVGGFSKIARKLRASLPDWAYDNIRGTTDSEHVFALFRQRWKALQPGDRVETMATALLQTFSDLEAMQAEAGVDEPSFLNIVVTDGRQAVATRYVSHPSEPAHSLYIRAGRAYTCENGECRMLESSAVDSKAVLVCSEPLSDEGGWTQVAHNHLVLVHAPDRVEIRAVG